MQKTNHVDSGLTPLMVLNNGQLDTAFDDARADGITGETGGVADVEFLHDALAMFLDGFRANVQPRRDLFVWFAFSDQLEHFHFARSQFVVA